jgi:hypothetical protein
MHQRLKQQVSPRWQLVGPERRKKPRYGPTLDADTIGLVNSGNAKTPVDVQAAHRLGK